METLAQFQGKMDLFQGNMNAKMEYLQAHKATTSTNTIIVVTDATIVIIITADTVVNTMIQPIGTPYSESSYF